MCVIIRVCIICKVDMQGDKCPKAWQVAVWGLAWLPRGQVGSTSRETCITANMCVYWTVFGFICGSDYILRRPVCIITVVTYTLRYRSRFPTISKMGVFNIRSRRHCNELIIIIISLYSNLRVVGSVFLLTILYNNGVVVTILQV